MRFRRLVEIARRVGAEVDYAGALVAAGWAREIVALVVPQPPPTGDGPEVSVGVPRLAAIDRLLVARAAFGALKYGTPLRLSNGRRYSVDALQEALDGVVYTTAALESSPPGPYQESMEAAKNHFIAAARYCLFAAKQDQKCTTKM